MIEATSEGPFRIYILDEHAVPSHVASCDEESLGFALMVLYEEKQIEDSRVGIMWRPDPDLSGEWIINPFGMRVDETAMVET